MSHPDSSQVQQSTKTSFTHDALKVLGRNLIIYLVLSAAVLVCLSLVGYV